MSALSNAHVGKRMAFVVNGHIDLKDAATVRSGFSDRMSMSFASMDEANAFIASLRN